MVGLEGRLTGDYCAPVNRQLRLCDGEVTVVESRRRMACVSRLFSGFGA
jgi:hypothetical protein